MCVQVVCVCVGGWVLCVNERVCERVCVCVCVCVWGDLHTRSAVAPRRMLRRLSPCISAACSRCSRSDRTSASLNALGFALPPSLSRTSAHTHTHTHIHTLSYTQPAGLALLLRSTRHRWDEGEKRRREQGWRTLLREVHLSQRYVCQALF